MKTMLILSIAFFSSGTLYSQIRNGIYLDKKDNKEYKTISIGKQVCLAENFSYLAYVDTINISVFGYKGNSIKKAKSTLSFKNYAALYSWDAAKKLAPEG
ncbi:hypothetical protein [Pedobacter sp.]|uniref:hypothetical protein n=1 Tax=Pedobacter sp. TaxID=1411316 RepID=UPI003D7FD67E